MPRINLDEFSTAENSMIFELDGGGREIIDKEIEIILSLKGKANVLEIGTYLGSSAIRWLNLNDIVNLVVNDLFQANSDGLRLYIDNGVYWAVRQFDGINVEAFLAELDKPHGHIRCFKKNILNFIDRVTVYKGDFKQEAQTIATNHDIDLVYLDADKSYEILRICGELFPNAKLTGDDWTWSMDQSYPIKTAVMEYCDETKKSFRFQSATWVID